ncbi:hypothetical protein EYF80_047616 [Liparis tanakae]|uniref:Uncharacterized protein n=1 Tax=Liparis tanakae TaxID=230148 RepID=A0A4Z2FMZ0_9TELE|nr:hypothetical protein EYF80_047616 [Liparis tanakae]
MFECISSVFIVEVEVEVEVVGGAVEGLVWKVRSADREEVFKIVGESQGEAAITRPVVQWFSTGLDQWGSGSPLV